MPSKESPVADNPILDLKPAVPQTIREEGTAPLRGCGPIARPAAAVTSLPGGTVREDY